MQSLLPAPWKSEIQIKSYFLPSKQLGGDFFYYDWIHGGSENPLLRFYFLDVSGHGLRSALLSVSIRNFLQLTSLEQRNINLSDPGKILALLNENFSMEDHNGQYFTIIYGIYDRATQCLTYANAGHPPAILLSPPLEGELKNESQCLKATGIPVGFMPGFQFGVERHIIPPGSKLYVFSDGIYEIIDESTGKPWGFERFAEVLEVFYDQPHLNLADLIQQIQAETKIHSFDDDCAILELNLGQVIDSGLSTESEKI